MPFNLFIVGVGGQGVITLAEIFRGLCLDNAIQCTGSILKGGAQRLGTVQASLRLFLEPTPDYRNYSVEIPDGRLDLMIALEPWEGLRFSRLCSAHSRVVINSAVVPLMLERTHPQGFGDPVSKMSRFGIELMARNFTDESLRDHGSKKMLNYAMGKFAVSNCLPFFTTQQFDKRFEARTGVSRESRQ